METFYFPNESDFKKWIKDAVNEYFQAGLPMMKTAPQKEEDLLNRKEVARLLKISLVTLTDWVKRGLPSHKQRGRVYFVKSEVLQYISKKEIESPKIGSRINLLDGKTA